MKEYWLDPKIKYSTFKRLWYLNPPDMEAVHLCKIAWEMLKERKINISLKDEMYFTLNPIPKNAKIISSK